MKKSEIQVRLDKAVRELIDADRYLLEVDAAERAISHKLAEHVLRNFPEFHVDCEYNRAERAPKILDTSLQRLQNLIHDGKIAETLRIEDVIRGRTEARVFPDIIVHKRGSMGSNLLAIEVKKQNCSALDIEWDRLKLDLYVVELNYTLGAHVTLKTGKEGIGVNERYDIEWR